ncbi:cupin domain-containing protein [Conexibacter sp. SYSU D00693]|uniref:cupin domain-containing protein n=1 Tax=Conexibacter sp. SYSU D00693 TaxID=2812560 RepID=UPI00196ABC01|nr:cupin domain-containing protein [Conexibacter sp. SYSU D00693]
MQSYWFLDTLVDVQVDGAATGGAYAIVTFVAPPGHMPPPHVHATEAEGILVLDGELTVHTGSGSTALGPGEAVHAPSGVPHTIEVTSDVPCRWTVVSSPAGFEDFVRAMGTPAGSRELPVLDGPPDVERLTRVAAEHGITFVDGLEAAAPEGALSARA